MNRRTFMTGIAASAVVPALPPLPVRAVTTTEVAARQTFFEANLAKAMHDLICYGQVWFNEAGEVVPLWSIMESNVELPFTLAGANFRPAAAKDFIKGDLNRDTKVFLVREPTNPYDSNAIQVICEDDMGEQVFIGFVPKSDNAVLAMALDADKPYNIIHTGFVGTLQPTFVVTFEPLSIEERNAALDNAEDADSFKNGGGPALDDEIPF